MKPIERDKLWYNFPVVIQSHSGEQAVSFKKVNLPESLPQIIVIALFLVQNDCVGIFPDSYIVFGRFLQPDGQKSKLVHCEVNF